MNYADIKSQGELLVARMEGLFLGAQDNVHINPDVAQVLVAASQVVPGVSGIDLLLPFEKDPRRGFIVHRPNLEHKSFLLPHANSDAMRRPLIVNSPFHVDRTRHPLIAVTFMSHRSPESTVRFDVKPRIEISDHQEEMQEAVISIQAKQRNLISFGKLTVGFAFRSR